MKIYTGTGDHGKTSLFNGERVPKSHDRIEAAGDVDELNSVLGFLIGLLPEECSHLADEIQRIQSDLLHVGAWIATLRDSPSLSLLQEIDDRRIRFLEEAIDRMDSELPSLKTFIIPGGHPAATHAHFARTVCRRAERHTSRISYRVGAGEPPIGLRGALIYLNRLSDYLFMLARLCNHVAGFPEQPWKK